MSAPAEQEITRCDYLSDGKTQMSRCERSATHRSPTDARCEFHGGHLDYTERWNGTAWEPMPSESALAVDAAMYARLQREREATSECQRWQFTGDEF